MRGILYLSVLALLGVTTNAGELTKEEPKPVENQDRDTSKENEGEVEEGSAASGDDESIYNAEGKQPKPGLPYPGFGGPMKIVPFEANVNQQRPVNRKCFFCFPRGRLGRVQVTGAGGPFLLNGGFMPRPMAFPMMGYPGMGFPAMGMIYPQGGCPGGCGPGFGAGCCGGCGMGPVPFPIMFQGFKKEKGKGKGKQPDKKASYKAQSEHEPGQPEESNESKPIPENNKPNEIPPRLPVALPKKEKL